MLNPNDILTKIGLTPTERSVYTALLKGAVSAREIMQSTGEKRPTVYHAVYKLEDLGLVSKTGAGYGNSFQIEPVEKLQTIIKQRIADNQKLLKETKVFTNQFTQKRNSKNKISYFNTIESIKNEISYSLYAKKKTIYTIVPSKNFFSDTEKEFRDTYVKEKLKRDIKTKALWENIPSKKVISSFYGKNSEIKQLPITMHNSFQTTVFIYDDKTLYISPKKENYAVLIQSKEHTNMMIAMFKTVWNQGFEI